MAEALSLSEATVSRRSARVRACLRERLAATFSRYSFSSEERSELARSGLAPNPNPGAEAAFDAALAEVFHRLAARRHEGLHPAAARAVGTAADETGALARLRALLAARGARLPFVRPALLRSGVPG